MEFRESDEMYDGDFETCDTCGGVAYLMGFLGKKAWFRCQACGEEFSIITEEDD